MTWDFALIGIHVKPDHAVEEIGALLDVYNDVRQTWRDVEVYIPSCKKIVGSLSFYPVLTIPLKYGPRRGKTCLRGVRQSEFQTSLLSYSD